MGIAGDSRADAPLFEFYRVFFARRILKILQLPKYWCVSQPRNVRVRLGADDVDNVTLETISAACETNTIT